MKLMSGKQSKTETPTASRYNRTAVLWPLCASVLGHQDFAIEPGTPEANMK